MITRPLGKAGKCTRLFGAAAARLAQTTTNGNAVLAERVAAVIEQRHRQARGQDQIRVIYRAP